MFSKWCKVNPCNAGCFSVKCHQALRSSSPFGRALTMVGSVICCGESLTCTGKTPARALGRAGITSGFCLMLRICRCFVTGTTHTAGARNPAAG